MCFTQNECCFAVAEIQLSILWERMSGVSSSSLAPPLSKSWASVVYVVCSCVVGWVIVVVVMGGVVSRVRCLGLLLT